MLQMKDNLKKTSERGERLDDLQDKTDALATQANGFRRGANRVRKQMWWKDMKMRMCLVAGLVILILVVVVPSGKSALFRRSSLGGRDAWSGAADVGDSVRGQTSLSHQLLDTSRL